MKAYELLKLAKPILESISSAGLSPKDIKHLDLYSDYQKLKQEGHKVAYIEAHICEQYGLGKTHFFNIVKKFDTNI